MAKAKNTAAESKSAGSSSKIDYTDLRKAVMVLRAVNHKLRQKMIDLIEEHDRITVTEIYVKLRMEQSVASQHLAILRRAGVVITQREGKFIFYSLDKHRLDQVAHLVSELAVAPTAE